MRGLDEKVDHIANRRNPAHGCRGEVQLSLQLILDPQGDLRKIQTAEANFRHWCLVVPYRLLTLVCKDLIHQVQYLLSFHKIPFSARSPQRRAKLSVFEL